MKVILLDNIKGVGLIGDVKAVSDGYARNFLLPRHLAKPATINAIKDVEVLKQKRTQVLEAKNQNATKIAETLKDVTLEFKARASEKGTLFDSIDRNDIIKKLKETANVIIEADNVKLDQPIKVLGEHMVTLELSDQVTAQLKVLVNKES